MEGLLYPIKILVVLPIEKAVFWIRKFSGLPDPEMDL
jgi:hypothetical protein